MRKLMALEYQKKIVSSWFERRRRDPETSFDPFIYTWIALNAALSARYDWMGDRAKVVKFADELAPHWKGWMDSDERLRDAVNALVENSPIYDERPDRNGRRRQIFVEGEDSRTVMAGIYAIRNNLFHGAKEFDVPRDHVLVTSATEILERVFIDSGLYDMARQRGRDMQEAIRPTDARDAAAS